MSEWHTCPGCGVRSKPAAQEAAEAEVRRLRSELVDAEKDWKRALRERDEEARLKRMFSDESLRLEGALSAALRERDEANDRWARAHGEPSRIHGLLDGADGVLDRVRAVLDVPPGANIIEEARRLLRERDEAREALRGVRGLLEHEDFTCELPADEECEQMDTVCLICACGPHDPDCPRGKIEALLARALASRGDEGGDRSSRKGKR